MNRLIALGILTALLWSLGTATQAQTPSSDCADLTGAARGLCNAALRLGCGTDDEKRIKACSKIEDNYEQIADEPPPWLAACPCWSNSELTSLRHRADGESSSCFSGPSIVIDTIQVDSWNVSGGGREDHVGIGTTYKVNRGGIGNPDIDIFECRLSDTCSSGECLNISRQLEITEEEYIDCTIDVASSGIERGFDCWD